MAKFVLHARKDGWIPSAIRMRFEELLGRLEAETLTPEEHEELLGLVEQVEALQVERVTHLTRIAQSRGVALGTLMVELEISGLEHG